MPIFRYFLLVGGCLVVLLLAADRYLPRPLARASAVDVDRSIIRIRSARVGPDKVEFDTAHPPQGLPASQAERHDDAPLDSFAMISETVARPKQPAPAVHKGYRVRTAHVRHRTRRPQERLIALDHPQPSIW